MMMPTHTPPVHSRRKISVEIYFVLYLIAILLLIGSTPGEQESSSDELEDAIISMLDTDFRLDVERIALIVPFGASATSTQPVSSPSFKDTVNVIRAHGSFSSVSFKIVSISDSATDDLKGLEKGTLVRKSDSSVAFQWISSREERQTVYRVSVAAIAQPKLPASVTDPEARQRILRVVQERKPMVDTVSFTVNVLRDGSEEYIAAIQLAPLLRSSDSLDRIDSTAQVLNGIFNNLSVGPGSQLIASPQFASLPASVNIPWRQKITLLGNDRDVRLVYPPSGIAMLSQTPNLIEVSGTEQSAGTRQVRLILRTGDGKESSVYFNVEAFNLRSPNVPSELYAGSKRSFDFSPSATSSVPVQIIIRENNREAYISEDPTFEYTPQIEEGTVEFERRINGTTIDVKRATVHPPPVPVIRLISRNSKNGEIIYETTSYGRKDDLPNEAYLRILEGQSVEDPVLLTSSFDPVQQKFSMRWKVMSKSGSLDNLRFVVKAWDKYGESHSAILPYGG